MEAYLIEFGNMLLRWLHVIAAIAWIGESFYFVMLDNGLHKPASDEDKRRGVFGEMWAVHGGGFYHNQKYATAPAKLPDDLHWSFLKAYTTWISGFALFAALYLMQPELYLVNHGSDWSWAANLVGWQASVAAVVFLLLGWVIYNEMCKRISPTMESDGILGVAVMVMMLAVCYLSTQIFSGRAAFLLTGAVMATAMAANVFFWIIPGQRRMVAAMKAGEDPDPLDGKRGKQRSVHNTYFTLPAVFLMLSNHYSFLYTSEYSWVLMALFIVAGALIRQFFVLMHAGQIRPLYPVAGAVIIAAIIWFAAPISAVTAPPAAANDTVAAADSGADAASGDGAGGSIEPAAAGTSLAEATHIVKSRCAQCHSANPTQAGFPAAPAGIMFDSEQDVAKLRAKIKQVVASGYMPLGNMTDMTDEERAAIAAWQK